MKVRELIEKLQELEKMHDYLDVVLVRPEDSDRIFRHVNQARVSCRRVAVDSLGVNVRERHVLELL